MCHRCIAFHRFQSALLLFPRAVVFLTKKGAFTGPGSPLGQFSLRGFASRVFLIWIFLCVFEMLGTSPPHPFSSESHYDI